MAQESIHEDIKWLEAQLEAKKKALSEIGENKEEKEILTDILKEPSQGAIPPAGAPSAISDDDAEKKAYDLQEKEHAEIIEELIKMAFAKNFLSAEKVAKNMRNPHLLDEFHDVLADHYYEKLLESRKLKT